MAIAKVSSKGQITLPAAARRQAGIEPGDRVEIQNQRGEIIIRVIPDFFELQGFLGPARPLEEEREAGAEAAAEAGEVR